MEYKIISSHNLDDLSSQISCYLNEGWKLIGNMYILPEQVLPTYINYNKAPPQNLSDKLSNGITYIQPIIKDNISIKEKEINDLPSNKMILYATDICRNLKINLPDQLTKEAYKDFISKYKDDNLKNLKNSYSKDYDEREDINYYEEDEIF